MRKKLEQKIETEILKEADVQFDPDNLNFRVGVYKEKYFAIAHIEAVEVEPEQVGDYNTEPIPAGYEFNITKLIVKVFNKKEEVMTNVSNFLSYDTASN